MQKLEWTEEETVPEGKTSPGKIFNQVWDEFTFATTKFGSFNSAHEGFAVLNEEVDELWDEVKAKQGDRDLEKMRKEALQVAAMAIRFVHDICDGGR